MNAREELTLVRARLDHELDLTREERFDLETRWLELSESTNNPTEIKMSEQTDNFERDQDALHREMFGGPAPAQPKPKRVRADAGTLDMGEVTAKYPKKEERDELLVALRMEQAGAGLRLSEDERPFAEALAAAEDHTVALEEARAKFDNN